MSEHLPECPTAWMRDCICTELRMCEERVRQGMESLAHVYEQDAYMRGWDEALSAARDAVAASGGHSDRCICDECYGTAAALAAIDALREEQK